MRRLLVRTALGLVVIFVIAGILWGTATWKTVVFLSNALPDTPAWLPASQVLVERNSWEFTASDQVRTIDLYHSDNVQTPSPALILVPGLSADAHKDERLVRVAEAMAAVGVAVAVPHSDNISALTLDTDDIQLIIDTFYFLAEHEDVVSNRIGLAGFSVAGSYALRAGLELDNSPAVVLALGPYHNASNLLVDILSRSAHFAGITRDWYPDDHVINITKDLLRPTDERLAAELPKLTRDEAETFLNSLPEELQTLLTDISPSTRMDELRAPLILMHDQHDTLIPVEASRQLHANLPEQVTVSYHEYTFLHHVTPQRLLTWELFPFAWQIFQLFNHLF